ncbi:MULTISPECIES: DUF6431 domain-containing protein [Streptacidiphilus]|uniref:DUF6431 domain-containing protein n=1 Tax=Streptacidiphilus cavernicola TaxID=3342716 RepID=A0ABV6UP49_9ACTN|nr:DUF6431 domain-containing protein [Streptacidiphilus jeojiense]
MFEVLDAAAARVALARRALSCPDCVGALRPWGRARPRTVRDVGEGILTVRPDRARCTACKATHVVFAALLLPHRVYTVRFVGHHALVAAARGQGRRQIAAEFGAPPETVRGWVRLARCRAQELRALSIHVVASATEALPARVLG